MCIGYSSKSRRCVGLHAVLKASFHAASLPEAAPQQKDAQQRKDVHEYHDFAETRPQDDKVHIEFQKKLQQGTPAGGVATPFPLKLHELLDEVEMEGLSHIIGWQPHGRAFVVHDTKKFVELIMPRYFKTQSKFASFQRQLNLYNFRRLTAGIDRGGYYHEAFLRGKPFLSHRIQRARVNGKSVRRPANPDTEPNFYTMDAVGVGHSANIHDQHRQALSQRQLQLAMPLMRTVTRVQPTNLPMLNPAPMFTGSSQQSQVMDDPMQAPLPLGMEPTPIPEVTPSVVRSFCPSQDSNPQAITSAAEPAFVSDDSAVESSSDDDNDEVSCPEDQINEEGESSNSKDDEFEEELSKIFEEKETRSIKAAKDANEFFADFDLPFDLDESPIDDSMDDVEFGLLLEQAVE